MLSGQGGVGIEGDWYRNRTVSRPPLCEWWSAEECRGYLLHFFEVEAWPLDGGGGPPVPLSGRHGAELMRRDVGLPQTLAGLVRVRGRRSPELDGAADGQLVRAPHPLALLRVAAAVDHLELLLGAVVLEGVVAVRGQRRV